MSLKGKPDKMNKNELIEKIKEEKLIAIVRGIEADKCLKVADALYEGGFRLIEITFDQRKPETWAMTAEAITEIKKKYIGKMNVGAGTVVSQDLVDIAAAAGAEYMISPDVNTAVIHRTIELGLVSMPGALTPTEIMTAYNAGADFVKLFPIANMGLSYLKAIRAPISHIPMLAVGGVNEDNLKDFLNAGCCGAGIGGNLVNKQWIADGEYHKITQVASKMVQIVKA